MSAPLRVWFQDENADEADGDLVRRFVASRDEAAFAELVRRHGPMVLAACRRVLHPDTHSADDAFQAAFLVLATRAETVAPPGRVGAWLHGVAVNVARKARDRARRPVPADLDQVADRASGPDPDLADVRAALDEALAGLPANYRAAVVLCDLEQRSRADAAAALGWSEGTLSGRLARARKLLADRLARRGVTLPAVGIGGVLPASATAAVVPRALAASTLHLAALAAAGDAVSAAVAELAEGFPPVSATTPKLITAAILVLVLGGFGLYSLTAQPPAPPAVANRPAAAVEKWTAKHTVTHGDRVSAVAVGPDVVAVGDENGHLILWDAATGRRREILSQGTDGGGRNSVDGLRFSPDGATLFQILNRGGAMHQCSVAPQGRDYNGFADGGRDVYHGVTAGGRFWLTRSAAGNELLLKRNDPKAGKFTDVVDGRFAHANAVRLAAGDGDVVASVSWNRTATLHRWDKAKEKPLWEVDLGRMDPLALAVSPGGKLLAVTGNAGQVLVFDAATGREVVRAADLASIVWAAAFSPDGKRLVVGLHDGTARVLDAATGKELAELVGHSAAVQAVAFGPREATGPGGDRIVTGSADKTAKVWELAR